MDTVSSAPNVATTQGGEPIEVLKRNTDTAPPQFDDSNKVNKIENTKPMKQMTHVSSMPLLTSNPALAQINNSFMPNSNNNNHNHSNNNNNNNSNHNNSNININGPNGFESKDEFSRSRKISNSEDMPSSDANDHAQFNRQPRFNNINIYRNFYLFDEII